MTIASRTWHVDIYLEEADGVTDASAVLATDDTRQVRGEGSSRRAPGDTDVPEIGDEVAAGRALIALGHALLHTAEGDIESMTRVPAQVHD